MKKLISSLIIAGLLLANTSLAHGAANAQIIDKSKVNEGVLTVQYQQPENKVSKLLIEKDDKRYTYDLAKTAEKQNFPLQLGNGRYTVRIAELVEGNKYKEVAKETVTVDLINVQAPYLQSVQEINWNANSQAVKVAAELVKDLNNETDKIDAIYNYIITNIKYDNEKAATVKTGYLPNIDYTLAIQKGICYDYAALLASMLRSQGIPTKMVKGYAPNIEGFHAWNEVYVESLDQWITIDTVYDAIVVAHNLEVNMVKDGKLFNKTEEL